MPADPLAELAATLERIERKIDALGERRVAPRGKGKRQHRPPPGPPPDELAQRRADAALRRLGR